MFNWVQAARSAWWHPDDVGGAWGDPVTQWIGLLKEKPTRVNWCEGDLTQKIV